MSEYIVAVVVAIVPAIITGSVAYRQGGRKVRAEIRTANRKVWINRVIETVTDLMVVCEHSPRAGREITRLTVTLQLLVNPKATDKKGQQSLGATREKLFGLITRINDLNTAEKRESIPAHMRGAGEDGLRTAIIREVMTILGAEWRVVLDETRMSILGSEWQTVIDETKQPPRQQKA